jgi:hypothetical protein
MPHTGTVRLAVEIGVDPEAVLREVLSSTIRILASLNLSRDQIADCLEDTARHLRDGAAVDGGDADAGETEGAGQDASGDDADAWELDQLAANEDFHRELARLSKRVSARGFEETPEEVQQMTAICVQAIAALARAQRWYEKECAARGLAFAVSLFEWRESATDDMLDNEASVVFFDQLTLYSDSAVDRLESVARAAQRFAMAEPLVELLARISEVSRAPSG